MPTGMGKCARCGSGFIKTTSICEKCLTGFPLCRNCEKIWKSYRCPHCDTMFANWKTI